MNLTEKIDTYQVVRERIKQNYVQLNELQKEIIDEMLQTNQKSIELNDGRTVTLAWIVQDEIDYERMKRLHPDVYQAGLVTTFSKTVAMRSAPSKLIHDIVKECSKRTMNYQLKTIRVKKGTSAHEE